MAQRWNPIIRAQKQRLLQRGKVKMVTVGAAMRKLLRLVYGVLKTRKAFDPNYLVNVQKTASPETALVSALGNDDLPLSAIVPKTTPVAALENDGLTLSVIVHA